MIENTDNPIPIAKPVGPDSEAALAQALAGNTVGDVPLIRKVIDVYQGYLQTMWAPIALTLGPTVTAYVFRSVILHDNRLKGLRRHLDITKQGISLRRLEGKLGHPRSTELVALLSQMCNALDLLACHILAGPPDHNSRGDTGPGDRQ